ncbi:hypothetical protein F5Y11DRAFT_14041 [Daldinia sp. FL1419]|nr:hypothetical protein F5Y11DRAFT_14041 [Daldinia sp. FL1419]
MYSLNRLPFLVKVPVYRKFRPSGFLPIIYFFNIVYLPFCFLLALLPIKKYILKGPNLGPPHQCELSYAPPCFFFSFSLMYYFSIPFTNLLNVTYLRIKSPFSYLPNGSTLPIKYMHNYQKGPIVIFRSLGQV